MMPIYKNSTATDRLSIFQAGDFNPARLAGRGIPELFSLGSLCLGEHQIAAPCPIFWEESVFINGENADSAVSARFLEGVALQIFAQAPERVKIIVYDSTFDFNATALESVAEIIKANSRESAIEITKSPKEFEEVFNELMKEFIARKRRLAIEAKNNWQAIFQEDDSSTIFVVLIKNPCDLCERPAFDQLTGFLYFAAKMGILFWIDGTTAPEFDEHYRQKRIHSWNENLKAACPIQFNITKQGLTPHSHLCGFQPFSTYLELGLIQPFVIDAQAQHAYIQLTRERFSTKKKQQQQDFISVEIGKQNGQPFILGIGPGSDVYHSILAGVTGSGKTSFLKHFLALVCEKYTPSEVLIHLYDFKRGASLSCYARIPNFKSLFECSDNPEKAIKALDNFVKEAQRRQDIFTQAQKQGMAGDSLVAYNSWAEKNGGEKLPLQLMIIDELGQLYRDFKETGKSYQLTQDFSRRIVKVANQGRSQGMFLFLSSQHFADVDIDSAITNCQLRMSMRLDLRSQCSRIFQSGNTAAYDLLKKVDSGSARDILINNNAGRQEANHIVRLPFMSDESLQARLDALKSTSYNADTDSTIYMMNEQSKENNADEHSTTENAYINDIVPDSEPLDEDDIP